MMTYPSAEDYIRAVQNPDVAFSAPRLQAAQFAKDPIFDIPMPAAGNAAVVFRAEVDGGDRALRFYTRDEDPDTRKRYSMLGRALTETRLGPHVATAAWIDQAITVRQQRWPMVEMQWVDGRTLDAYVSYLAGDGHTDALGVLARNWRSLIGTLQSASFAHGDLQHGNVLIDTQSKFRLVDFDGSWIEPFDGMEPPSETGHPNYQRTGRPWGRWMDTFPGLVVYTALLGLSRNPDRWSTDLTEDKILFAQEDFAAPFRTRTWARLDAINDSEVTHAAAVLKRCCDPSWMATGTLEDLLSEKITVPFRPSRRIDVPDDEPWWVKTGAVPPKTITLPPPPEAVTPAAAQPGPWQGGEPRTGTTPIPGWYKTGPTVMPPSPHKIPPPATRGPRRKSDLAPAIAGAILLGIAFGVLTAVLGAQTSLGSSAPTAGVVAGLIFGLLMLVILRRKT